VAVVLPPLPFGASFFHGTRMAGTVGFTGEETATTARLVAEACVDSGFRRLLFVNGHVGTGYPSRAVKSMGLELWRDVVAASRDLVERAHSEKPPLG
jgi:creatinine amidohydrolase/Fe(II)-dependent formamide hydrolase-like protein